jgi:hypothetical protein
VIRNYFSNDWVIIRAKSGPGLSPASPVLQMQRQLGNRAVVQMMMNGGEEEEKQPDEQKNDQQATTSESSRETSTTMTTTTTSNTNEESKTSDEPNPKPVIDSLKDILKKDKYRNLIKGAKDFCRQGGVGRNLVPPQEITRLFAFLESKESAIKSLLAELSGIKANLTKKNEQNALNNTMVDFAGRVMDGINLVIDGINKAEANARAWMLDGNETEVDGVQPPREMAFKLYDLWEAASSVHPGRKRATLVAPASKRKENAKRNFANGSYAALKNPDV